MCRNVLFSHSGKSSPSQSHEEITDTSFHISLTAILCDVMRNQLSNRACPGMNDCTWPNRLNMYDPSLSSQETADLLSSLPCGLTAVCFARSCTNLDTQMQLVKSFNQVYKGFISRQLWFYKRKRTKQDQG